jgi:hypothetical protein
MGLRDKLTDLREQAQQAVSEHKDEIKGAMETAGSTVDQKTHGKYTDKIAKYGQKATDAVEKFGSQGSSESGAAEHPDTPAGGTPAADSRTEGQPASEVNTSEQ